MENNINSNIDCNHITGTGNFECQFSDDIHECSNCSYSSGISKCLDSKYLQDSTLCVNCDMSSDLIGCVLILNGRNCALCYNLITVGIDSPRVFNKKVSVSERIKWNNWIVSIHPKDIWTLYDHLNYDNVKNLLNENITWEDVKTYKDFLREFTGSVNEWKIRQRIKKYKAFLHEFTGGVDDWKICQRNYSQE